MNPCTHLQEAEAAMRRETGESLQLPAPSAAAGPSSVVRGGADLMNEDEAPTSGTGRTPAGRAPAKYAQTHRQAAAGCQGMCGLQSLGGDLLSRALL